LSKRSSRARSAGAGSGRGGETSFGSRFRNSKKVPEKQAVVVDLPDVVEERAGEALALGERGVEEGEAAEGDAPFDGAVEHPSEARAGDCEGDGGGRELGQGVGAGEVEPSGADAGAQALIRLDETGAGAEEAQLGGGLAGGEDPVVVPGAAFVGGGAEVEFMAANGVPEDDDEGGQGSGGEGEGNPGAEAEEEGEHGDQGDAALEQSGQGLDEHGGAVGGLAAGAVEVVVEVGGVVEAELDLGRFAVDEEHDVVLDALCEEVTGPGGEDA
jgi:hypothetical protein